MRPHRNPASDDSVQINQEYLDYQHGFPEDLREADWQFPAEEDLSQWIGWRQDQPNDWFGGFRNLPTIWGGPNEDHNEVNAFLGNEQPEVGLRAFAARPRARAEPNPQDQVLAFKKIKALNLEKLKPGDPVQRDVSLPPFHVDYDNYEQINTKLNQTVIMIKDNPYLVRGVYDLGNNQFGLNVLDSAGSVYGIEYKDVADCRPIAPGYVTRNGSVYWLYRGPERQNQQGMNHRNTFIKPVNTTLAQGARTDFLLGALSNRKDMRYEPVLGVMIQGGAVSHLRLSNNVAIFHANKKGAPIGVEYCGRNFGLIVEGGVKVLDENDLRPSWIHKDLNAVNLAVRA